MIYFLIFGVMYIALCMLGFKLYFFLQQKNLNTRDKLKKGIVSYVLFILFICIEIPFTIFFPVWLNTKLNVIKENSESTMYLLIFGVVVLGLSIWHARKDRPKGF
ncbi:MAG: hypothetical protein JG763_911 [Shewanella sp.]|jgi:drug/metabolite transporter (DMT)-like permease|nr:hypothetical protein [Shewanella sp.]HCD12483.1 hypothetical protein [Shewanella sp.]